MIDSKTLTRRAAELVTLDGSGTVKGRALIVSTLMQTFGITKARASTAVARAARQVRYQRTTEDDDEGQMTHIIRVKVTERQREHLQISADRETGGDMSKLVRRRLFT